MKKRYISTFKLDLAKEEDQQVIEKIHNRDRQKYRKNSDYLKAAVRAFDPEHPKKVFKESADAKLYRDLEELVDRLTIEIEQFYDDDVLRIWGE